MQFDSFSQFFAMGGYGFYVWLSFGSGLVLIGLLILHSRYQHSSVKQQIAKKLSREMKLKQVAEQHSATNNDQ